MDHEWNGNGNVSEMKWDARQDDKWNGVGMNIEKGKIYWWNMTMGWSETIKIKQSEMRWLILQNLNYRVTMASCHYLLQKENGKYRVLETSDFHPVFSV